MKKLHISKRVLIISGIWLLAVLSFIATGNVFAKYVYTHEYDPTHVTAKAFYFESDYLTTRTDQTYYPNATTQSVSFNLYNYNYSVCPDPACAECENASQVDCTYTITVTSYNRANSTYEEDFTFEVKVGETVKNTPTTTDEKAKTMQTTATANKKTVQTVTISGIEPNHDYKVTVTANGGYTKTLQATFSVAKLEEGFFMNLDTSNDEFIILTVWTVGNSFTGEATISVPAGLIPDATDSKLTSIDNYNAESGKYTAFDFGDTVSAFSARSYRFFKTADYNSNDKFTVKIGETFAKESDIS